MRWTLFASVPLLFTVRQEAPKPEDLRPGLVGEYFHIGTPLADFPALEPGAKPRFKRVDKQVDFLRTLDAFGGTKLKDQFFVRWTGFLRVAKGGKLRLSTVSDDGSRLYVGAKLVVQNGGRHEMKEAAGEIELAAGDHEIRVEYFEDTKHAGVRVQWEGDGLAKDVIPASAFWHHRDRAPSEEERKGVGLPVEEARAEKGRDAPAKTGAEKKPEPPKEVAFDENVVGKDEPRPEIWGRVTGVFEDGPTTLLTVKRAGTEYSVFLHKDTKLAFLGAGKGQPAAGQSVYVWLKPGTTDAAATAKFAK